MIQCELKRGDFIVTSKGRFGTILEVITNQSEIQTCKVQIGNNAIFIKADQLRIAKHTTPLHVDFSYTYNGKVFDSTDIVHIPKESILFSESDNNQSIKEVVSNLLFKKTGFKVNVNLIKTI